MDGAPFEVDVCPPQRESLSDAKAAIEHGRVDRRIWTFRRRIEQSSGILWRKDFVGALFDPRRSSQSYELRTPGRSHLIAAFRAVLKMTRSS
jgi:hypothetical protein